MLVFVFLFTIRVVLVKIPAVGINVIAEQLMLSAQRHAHEVCQPNHVKTCYQLVDLVLLQLRKRVLTSC